MRSSILGIYPPGIVFRPSATNNGQFGKLTDHTEGTQAPELKGQFDKLTDRTEGTPVPELAEGDLPKQYIYTVAHASGSECGVLFPWLFFCFCFCLFFFPWLMLLLLLILLLPSVFFRVRPWQMLLLLSLLPSVVSSYFRVIS